MGLNKFFSYWGQWSHGKASFPVVDEMIKESELLSMQELKEMEERIKRHITECKRDMMKILKSLTEKPKEKKKHGCPKNK